MQKVLIDYTYYEYGTYHGGGEYGDTVLRRLMQIRDEEIHFGLVYHEGMQHRLEPVEECRQLGWEIHTIREFSDIVGILRDNGYNRFYSALPYQPGRGGVGLPEEVEFVATYHGLREIELMDYVGLRRGEIFGIQDMDLLTSVYGNYRDALMMTSNRRIVTVSEHSKYSLIQYFPTLCDERIDVLYAPMKLTPDELPDKAAVLDKYGIKEGKYALMVSAGTWYKNAINAAVAYDMVFDSDYPFISPDYKVVIVGGKDNAEIAGAIHNNDRYVLLSFVSTEELEVLYKYAQLFVFPSLNEGFGYPPLEAMKYGTICACAASTSITEICRDMVLYFNPLMIGEIVNRILQSFSENIRQTLVSRMTYLQEINGRQKRDLDKLAEIITYGDGGSKHGNQGDHFF